MKTLKEKETTFEYGNKGFYTTDVKAKILEFEKIAKEIAEETGDIKHLMLIFREIIGDFNDEN